MSGLWIVFISVVMGMELSSAETPDNQDARADIAAPHKLDSSDISQLLKDIKTTNSGKAFRGSGSMSGPFEFQFGENGAIRYSRQRMRGSKQSSGPSGRSNNPEVDVEIASEYTASQHAHAMVHLARVHWLLSTPIRLMDGR